MYLLMLHILWVCPMDLAVKMMCTYCQINKSTGEMYIFRSSLVWNGIQRIFFEETFKINSKIFFI